MLAFCSVINYIHLLTTSTDLIAFSQCGMVGASWHIFDGASWQFSMNKQFHEPIQYFYSNFGLYFLYFSFLNNDFVKRN